MQGLSCWECGSRVESYFGDLSQNFSSLLELDKTCVTKTIVDCHYSLKIYVLLLLVRIKNCMLTS